MPHRLRHSGAEALHREMSCLFQSSLPRNVFPLVCPLPCCRCEQQLNPKSVAPGVRTCSHAPSLLEGSLLRTRSSNTVRCTVDVAVRCSLARTLPMSFPSLRRQRELMIASKATIDSLQSQKYGKREFIQSLENTLAKSQHHLLLTS